MTAQAIYVLWLRDLKWFIRAKARVISWIVTPFLWLAIIGVGLDAALSSPNFNYLEFMAPGIVGMTILFASTMAGVSVIWDKQFGFMKEILVAPVSRIYIMFGKVLGGATMAILQGVLLLLAIGLFDAIGLIDIRALGIVQLLQIFVFMVLISLAFVSVGLAFASRIDDPIAFPFVINFFIMPVFFTSGAIYPVGATLPSWLSTIARLNPLTYGIDGLRGAICPEHAQFSMWLDFGVILVFSLAMILLGGYLFRKISA
jgi:ABC-2 type transport system permease protein